MPSFITNMHVALCCNDCMLCVMFYHYILLIRLEWIVTWSVTFIPSNLNNDIKFKFFLLFPIPRMLCWKSYTNTSRYLSLVSFLTAIHEHLRLFWVLSKSVEVCYVTMV